MARNNMIDNFFQRGQSTVDRTRSVFPYKKSRKGGYQMGFLYPVDLIEIYPGDTFSLDIAAILRSGTFIGPLMDDIYVDFFAFYVPNRIVWNHWKQFLGENDVSAWTDTNEYSVPEASYILEQETLVQMKNMIGIHMGLPAKVYASEVEGQLVPQKFNSLPLRDYIDIYNTYFRDENVVNPVLYSRDDNESGSTTYASTCFKVAKFHDVFTSLLPSPQKGDPVELPMLGMAPLVGQNANESATITGGPEFSIRAEDDIDVGEFGSIYARYASGNDNMNLFADLSKATAATINDLRYSIMMQRYLEACARGGTRSFELIKQFFGVDSGDLHDRPELLIQKRFAINIDQVVSTAATEGENSITPLGDVAAYSVTSIKDSLFTKSFTEHGFVHILMCIRQQNTYSNIIEPMFRRKNKFDYYWPTFDHIGEVPVTRETYGGVYGSKDVVGFQEAWWDLRKEISHNVGYLDPAINGSLNYLTLGTAVPEDASLTSTLINETDANFKRALVDANGIQFYGDFYIHGTKARVLSGHSTPGIIGRI